MNNLQKAFTAGLRTESGFGRMPLLGINHLAHITGLIDGVAYATGNQAINEPCNPHHSIKRTIVIENDDNE